MESRLNHGECVDTKTLMRCLRVMLLGRLTEERMVRLYHQGKIFGGVYTGIGQEAIGAASTVVSQPEDLLAPSIRSITVHIGRGTSVLDIFRQFLGRETGPMRGRDGNVHYGQLDKGIYAMISHMCAMLPVVIGAVMARRRERIKSVGFCYIGDGASSTGDFHEAVNFASVYHVPMLFIIENNHYAYSTPTRFQYACKNLVDRAQGYGMEGFSIDGNDAVCLITQFKTIIDSIRNKPRPVLIECDTMRMRGHGEHDDASYIPKALHKKYEKRDPIMRLKQYLLDKSIVEEAAMVNCEEQCRQEVHQSYHQALLEPLASRASFSEEVYARA